MNTLVIFERDSKLWPAFVSDQPSSVILDGELYKKWHKSLGDYDCVRDVDGELAGFSFAVPPNEQAIIGRITGTKGCVEVKHNQVVFWIRPSHNYKVETIQASSWLYRNRRGRIAIGLHEWVPFGKTAVEGQDRVGAE